MKFKLSAAVAAALALSATQAFAFAPNDPANPIQLEVWMSGATAQDKGIASYYASICQPGTLDTYRDNANSAAPGAQHSAYFCKVDSTKVAGMAADLNVVFHKRSAGGSAMGVQPLLTGGIAIKHMNITNNNCTITAPDTFYRCTVSNAGDTQLRIPDAGVSDVNPELFTGVNTPAPITGELPAPAPVNPADVAANLDVTASGALIYGTPVTNDLFLALANAQQQVGRLGANCPSLNAAILTAEQLATNKDYYLNSATLNPECVPSLSKEQVASIVSGKLKKWTTFRVVDTNATPNVLKGDLTAFAVNGAPTTTNVGLCRRVNGSGTQAVTNLFFLNNPCLADATAPVSAGNPVLGPTVVLNSGSGNVETCLDDFNNNTNLGGQNAPGTGKGKVWSVGVQSLEFNANRAKAYRFVRIDGQIPTLVDTANGHYGNWAEQTIQWRKNTIATNPGPSGDTLNILLAVAANAGSPTTVATANAGFVHNFGASGGFAVSTGPFNPKVIFDFSQPVIGYSHVAGTSLNNCRAPSYNGNKVGITGGGMEM
ncbi:MAG: hypothetical protein ACKN9T_06120 [Candidatus Methylumidiphilus sp.]